MNKELGIYLMVLCTIYCFRYLLPIVIEMLSKEPKPIETPNAFETVLLYLASSFIITGLIVSIF